MGIQIAKAHIGSSFLKAHESFPNKLTFFTNSSTNIMKDTLSSTSLYNFIKIHLTLSFQGLLQVQPPE